METKAFFQMMEEITGADPDSINADTVLKGYEGWDSLAIVQFIASIDEHMGITLPVKEIAKCQTVKDLITLLEGRVN